LTCSPLTRPARVALVIDPAFYLQQRAVCALTPPLIEAFIQRFDAHLVGDQQTYNRLAPDMDLIFSFPPPWSAPWLKWRVGPLRRRTPDAQTVLLISDPHGARKLADYALREGIKTVAGYYDAPTRHHLPMLSELGFVHLPWAIPDAWIKDGPIAFHNQDKVALFGGSRSPAYDLRNWCRRQPGVSSYANSGCEQKVMSDRDFFHWLGGFDAIVAAGSDDPRFKLTTPKYFEIAAAGALLFAQETDDLAGLGFEHGVNCVTFTRATFRQRVEEYLSTRDDPRWIEMREAGRALVRTRHTISVRVDALAELASPAPLAHAA